MTRAPFTSELKRNALWLQDTSWADVYLSDIPHVVYQVNSSENISSMLDSGQLYPTLLPAVALRCEALASASADHVRQVSCVQVADSAARYTTSTNKGNEATPYLQYIIDHYDNLPKSIVFSHGHK